MIRILLALLLCLPVAFVSAHASTVQELMVKDGDTATIKMSRRELTRITVSGAGRLEKVWSNSNTMEITPDKQKGEVFVRPGPGAGSSFSFFVRDDQGSTYTLVAMLEDIPSQTVVLKPADIRLSSIDKSRWKQQPFLENVKALLRAMATGKDASGYTVEPRNARVPLWRETRIDQVQAYVGFALVGEIYLVRNVSKETLKFHEREFMDFGERVSAVALEKLEVAPGDTTTLYVVRRTEGS